VDRDGHRGQRLRRLPGSNKKFTASTPAAPE
jgi:hypothetical protein